MPKLPNVGFPSFFTNLNNLFDKALSWNKSSIAPSDNLVPGEIWVDSGNQNKLKVRNDANSAWIDTSLKVDQPYWGLDPATAQFNANKLQGQTVSSTTPTSNQIMIYQSGQWRPLSAIQLLSINSGSTSSQQILTSATLVQATGLSVTVTPKSVSSYFEIILHVNGIYKQDANTWLMAWLRRGATNLAALTGTATFNGSPSPNGNATISFTAVDFPATTSPVTYSIWVGNGAALGQVRIQSNNENSVIVVKEYVG